MEQNKNFELETENASVFPQQKTEESSFDIKTIFSLFILNWQWFALSMFIFVCGALIYLRYTTPMYQVTAKMLIKDEQNNRYRGNQMLSNMQDLGFISNSAGIDNEVEILQSRILAEEAVRDLKLYTEYRLNGKIRKTLIYKYQPINVDMAPDDLAMLDKTLAGFTFKLTRTNSGYEVKSQEAKIPFEGTFTTLPATLETPYGVLTFTKNVGEDVMEMDPQQSMLISIMSPVAVGAGYANKLSVNPTSKMTSIAQLTINDENRERAFDYLKHLAVCYNRQANADKNEIAYKTETFINERLEKINAELGSTESELEEYKRQHNLTELRLDANQTLNQSSQYAARLAEANTQIMLLDYLREHVDNPRNKYQIIPSNVGMSDPISASLINEYNRTVQDRERLLRSASENAPQVAALSNTLDNLQASIHDALLQARRSADITRQGIEAQYSTYTQRISNTPEQERILTQIGRQQEVKSGLYLMLLQKREENSISLAATADKGKLIDEPSFGRMVSPKKSVILFAAIVLGFAIPLLLVYVIQLLRYKIEGHEDVEKLTNIPIVADVAVASDAVKSAAGIVVHENTNNQIDEIFRSLRTNLQFMMTEGQKVILFTSTTSGEGKTFNAANVAMSFALLGKKVILCGFDIRKPALGRLFGITDRQVGVSTLLAKEHVSESDLRSQIRPSGVSDNLDLLMAGPTPPNPTELLARENMKGIIDMLREEYDYVILDTAPVGLVTDTLQIAKLADVTAFVCRADYTPKSSFGLINQLAQDKKLPNMCVVINGIDMSKKKYGYYYGYGRYGKYGRIGYGRYGQYGGYGNYGKYSYSHYSNKEDNSIKK